MADCFKFFLTVFVIISVCTAQRQSLNLSLAKVFDSKGSMAGLGEQEMVKHLKAVLSVTPVLTTRFNDDRFGGASIMGVNVQKTSSMPLEIAESAGCEPELVKVPIVLQNQSENTFIYPACTRMFRCGGCCSHPLLSCQPTDIKMEDKAVIIIDMSTGEDRREIVKMDQHLSCQCSCTTQAQHCSKLQRYLPEECRCACSKIELCSQDQRWDPDTCSCVCKFIKECSTGLYFDSSNCRCERAYKRLVSGRTSRPPINTNRRGSYWERRRNKNNDDQFVWD